MPSTLKTCSTSSRRQLFLRRSKVHDRPVMEGDTSGHNDGNGRPHWGSRKPRRKLSSASHFRRSTQRAARHNRRSQHAYFHVRRSQFSGSDLPCGITDPVPSSESPRDRRDACFGIRQRCSDSTGCWRHCRRGHSSGQQREDRLSSGFSSRRCES